MSDIIRRKPSSFEEYWLASKAWEHKGLTLGAARALANAGFLSVNDLHSACFGTGDHPKGWPQEPRDSVRANGSSDAWRTEEPDERQRAGTAKAQASSTNVRQRARAGSNARTVVWATAVALKLKPPARPDWASGHCFSTEAKRYVVCSSNAPTNDP